MKKSKWFVARHADGSSKPMSADDIKAKRWVFWRWSPKVGRKVPGQKGWVVEELITYVRYVVLYNTPIEVLLDARPDQLAELGKMARVMVSRPIP